MLIPFSHFESLCTNSETPSSLLEDGRADESFS